MKNLTQTPALALLSIIMMTSGANASKEDARGYQRDFSDAHRAGTICEDTFTNHPQTDFVEEYEVVNVFEKNASYYGNNLFHNRNEMSAGNKLHECDATVMAYNLLPLGTIVRITNPTNDKEVIVVVQDRTAEHVTRPDLSRGTFESLTDDGIPAEGILEDLIFEVIVPAE